MVVRGSKDVGSSAKVLGKNSTSHSSYHSRSNRAYKLPRIRIPIETLKAPSPAEKSWRFSPTSHRDWCEESVGGFKRMGLLFAVDVWMRKKSSVFFPETPRVGGDFRWVEKQSTVFGEHSRKLESTIWNHVLLGFKHFVSLLLVWRWSQFWLISTKNYD